MNKLEFVTDDVVVATGNIPISDETGNEKMTITEGSIGRILRDQEGDWSVAGFKIGDEFVSALLPNEDLGLIG